MKYNKEGKLVQELSGKMVNVIFNRPVRLGNINYPKSKRSVQIDESYLDGKMMNHFIKSGEVAIVKNPTELEDEDEDEGVAPNVKAAVRAKAKAQANAK